MLKQVCKLHSRSSWDSKDSCIDVSHSTECATDIEKELKYTHAKLEKQENQLNQLQIKYKEIEQLIVEKDEQISHREKDYYKACTLLHEVLHSNKQLKEENFKLHGASEKFSKTQSQTGSAVLDGTSVSQNDCNHQVMIFISVNLML